MKKSADTALLSFRVSKRDREEILDLMKKAKSRAREAHNQSDYLITSAEIVTYILKRDLPKIGKKDVKKMRPHGG